MNQVSKLLILLQLFLSIMFMAFAAAVYQAGTNWKKSAAESSEALQVSQKSLTDSQNAREDMKKEHNAAIKAIEQERDAYLAQYNNERDKVSEDRGKDGQPGRLAKALTERDVAQAEAKIATDEAAARVTENNQLREENRKLRGQVDSQVAQGRTKDDKILELEREKTAAISKDKADQAEIGRLAALVRLNGINPKGRIDATGALLADGREPIELVNGKVLSTKRSQSGSTEFVYVSLGQDDAVRIGNKLHIYRGSKFIADIKLIDVKTDGAVGIVNEKMRNGIIRRDDNVTSKL